MTALGIAGCAALLILLFGVAAEQWVAPTPLPSRLVLAEFCQCLSRHLPSHVPVEVPAPEARTFGIADLQALLPRSVVGIAITLTATSLAALVTSVATRTPSEPIAAIEAPRGPAENTVATQSLVPRPQDSKRSPEPSPSAAPAARPRVPLGPACRCDRHGSILWQRAVPRLSPLVISRQDRPHKAHNHIDLELAAVNNGDRSLEKLNVVVSFYEVTNGQRAQTVERTLYFEGPLGPGRAIKWQVEGRGTGFDVLAPDLGALDEDGSDAAPADALATLTAAHHRPVRMHAAMLLAYLGDPRGRNAALELKNADREDESSYLDRVLDSSSGLEVCHAELTPTADQRYALRACVFNRDDLGQGDLRLRIRWLETGVDPRSPRAEPPVVLGEYQQRLAGAIPRGEGREVEFVAELESDAAGPARAFELVADRTELPE